jgi:hypothetical protein
MGLETQQGSKTQVTLVTEALVEEKGRYVYCVAGAGEGVSLGKIGIEGGDVYTITCKDICAVVHNCPPQPYQSDNQEVVKEWVMTHQRVVDTAWERWGVVLPLSFDTIIREEAAKSAERNVKDWLEQEYEELKRRIEKVKGKAEYSVQVFWEPEIIVRSLTFISPEIKRLDEEIKSKPKGLGYMYRQKLENLIKHQVEAEADECFKNFYSRIRKYIDDVRVEKTRKAEPDLQMIMNLSCLVYRDRYAELGEELEKINRMRGFMVRFTGPWPPYSFVESA